MGPTAGGDGYFVFHFNGGNFRGLSDLALSGECSRLHQPGGNADEPGLQCSGHSQRGLAVFSRREENWPLAWNIIVGSFPGLFLRMIVRIIYRPDPRPFKLFAGGAAVIQPLATSRTPPHPGTRRRKPTLRPSSRSCLSRAHQLWLLRAASPHPSGLRMKQ